MKSLLISGMYFPPQVGGISRLMETLASSLGPDRICCLTGVAEDGGTAAPVGRGVYRYPAAFAQSRWRMRAAWAWAVVRIMVRERPRAVLLATIDDGPKALWLQRWMKLPYVLYANGNEISAVVGERGSRPPPILRRANRVVAISRFTAALLERAGVDATRVELIHPGCDVDRFRPLPVREDVRQKFLGPRRGDRVILTTGNLVSRKGHDMVVRSLVSLDRTVPNVTYLMVGDGPNRHALESLAADLGVRERVIFAGRVTDEELPYVYALSDVFVMPSREQLADNDLEGFGIVFLEASACGKPVVGGRSGGVPDAIEDMVTGLLVDAQDPGEIAAALARLLTDRDLATRLGTQGRARVVRDFASVRVAERVREILEAAGREGPLRG